MPGNYTYFFCIGTQKTGTTLLARLLDQHPEIACIWESYALQPNSPSSILNIESKQWSVHGFSDANIKKWHHAWDGTISPVLGRMARRFGLRDPFITRAFRKSMMEILSDFADRCGTTVVGDKWPWYIDYIKEIVTAFPNALFIYNVRDPRGLWNSAQKFLARKRGDEIVRKMLAKDKIITPYLKRPNFITVRYEDIVTSPEDSMRRLYKFLGKDYDPGYLQYDPAQDPYPDRWDWIPEATAPIKPTNATKWKTELDRATQERLAVEADWFIEKYSY